MNNNGLRNIHPGAKIGANVVIEPFATISDDVVIGEGTWIGPNVCIMKGTRIGKNCKIYPGAIIGADPQDLKFEGEYSTLEVGDNVVIREYCTINRGTKAAEKTVIGNNCLLMAYVHVAHDCVIGNNCVLANNVTLAGHIEVGPWAVLGGMTAVHQFVKIGSHVMIGGGSLVRKDVPPFIKAAREPLSYAGVNSIGLKRRQFTMDQIHQIQDVYRLLFIKGYSVQHGLKHIKAEIPSSPEREKIINFVSQADRGIIRGFRSLNGAS